MAHRLSEFTINQADSADGALVDQGTWDVFSRLMTAIDNAGVTYAILGDTTQYPAIDDGDIDIAIADSDFSKLEGVLMTFEHVHGTRLVQAIQHEQTSTFYVLAWGRPGKTPRYIQLDTCSHYFRSGTLLLTADELLANRQKVTFDDQELFVPGDGAQFVYYVVKKLKKGAFSESHTNYLRSVWDKMTDEEKKWAAQHFGQMTVGDLSAIVEESFGGEGMARLAVQFQPSSRGSFLHWIREKKRVIGRFLNPNGLFVVMMGPDGSGKTTINNLARENVDTAFWSMLYMHFRPFVGIDSDDSEVVEDPHAEPPRSGLSSIAKLVYYVADYIAGYWVKIRPCMSRSGLVIFDRYYQDMQIDERRYRYGGPTALLRLMRHVVPTPDLFVFLDVSAEEIQSRKQEVTFAETERQVEAYREMSKKLKTAEICNAGLPADQVATCVSWKILDVLSAKTAKRLGAKS